MRHFIFVLMVLASFQASAQQGYQQIGNQRLYQDGSSSQQIGNQRIYSNGVSAQQIGNQRICN